MKILVAGSRDYTNQQFVCESLEYIIECRWQTDVAEHLPPATTGEITLVHGNCRGADLLADQWAQSRGVNIVRVPALWNHYGKRAGLLRNDLMLGLLPYDIVVGFCESPTLSVGTGYTLRAATKRGLLSWWADMNRWEL